MRASISYLAGCALSSVVFWLSGLKKWLWFLSNTKWYFPSYDDIFLASLFLTGIWPFLLILKLGLRWPAASLVAFGHGTLVAVGDYALVYLLDGAPELLWPSPLVSPILHYGSIVAASFFPLLGWLFALILLFLSLSIERWIRRLHSTLSSNDTQALRDAAESECCSGSGSRSAN
jgi:hypothetical protein